MLQVDQTASFHHAPVGWKPSHPNPFSPDGAYGEGWSCFQLLDRDDADYTTGRSPDGPFGVVAGRRMPDLPSRLCDFLRYEHRHGRQVILAFPEGVDAGEIVRSAWQATADERAVRASDPPVVVHSTTGEAWKAIERDGMLKSAARLRAEGYLSASPLPETSELSGYYCGEPGEYADYIMFGGLGHPSVESILVSKERGSFCLDRDVRYEPGVRLYLDLHAVIRDGLGVRDGLHLAKVRDHLPLTPYLIHAIGVADIQGDRLQEWTPRLFTQEADRAFQQQWRRSGRHGGNA